MLDPLTAVSLAAAIVQFVDFSGKLFSETKELYGSAEGTLIRNKELREITTDLKQLCNNLGPAQQGIAAAKAPTPDEEALLQLSNSCRSIADELLAALEDLRVKAGHQKWESFKQALRSALKKEKIASIKTRLNEVQKQLETRLASILR